MKFSIKYVILAVLAALFITISVFDVKATIDGYNKVQELELIQNKDDGTKQAIREWKEITKKRAIECAAVIVCYGLVFILVMYVGPAPNPRVRISKEEAAKYAAEITKEYEQTGVLVEADYESVEEFKEVPKLETPVIKSIELADGAVMLKWNPVEHADGYYVYRKVEKGEWDRIGKSGGTTYKDKNFEVNTAYIYTLKAFIDTDDGRVRSAMDKIGKQIYIKGNSEVKE